MFRDFAKRKADALGLVGTAENQSDGAVCVIAEGEETKLCELLEHLKRGPILARVERIVEEWLPTTDEFRDFQIIFY